MGSIAHNEAGIEGSAQQEKRQGHDSCAENERDRVCQGPVAEPALQPCGYEWKRFSDDTRPGVDVGKERRRGDDEGVHKIQGNAHGGQDEEINKSGECNMGRGSHLSAFKAVVGLFYPIYGASFLENLIMLVVKIRDESDRSPP